MFTRKWMAATAVGLMSLAAIPVVSMAKSVAHRPTAPVAHVSRPVIAHKTTIAKKPVAKHSASKSHAKTTAKKHASKHVTKHASAKHHTAKHTAVKHAAVKHAAPVKKTATVAHKAPVKPVVVAAPPMF